MGQTHATLGHTLLMATFRRSTHGTTYFFTVVSNLRRPILCDEPIRDALRNAIKTTAQEYPFKIDAWVLMPDHLHAIWTLPADDLNYSRRWALIKRRVSQECAGLYNKIEYIRASNVTRHESTIWQRRFWEHTIRDDADFENHMNYVHFNPLKHGLVDDLSSWPYSTFQRCIEQGLYPADWCGKGLDFDGMSFGE